MVTWAIPRIFLLKWEEATWWTDMAQLYPISLKTGSFIAASEAEDVSKQDHFQLDSGNHHLGLSWWLVVFCEQNAKGPGHNLYFEPQKTIFRPFQNHSPKEDLVSPYPASTFADNSYVKKWGQISLVKIHLLSCKNTLSVDEGGSHVGGIDLCPLFPAETTRFSAESNTSQKEEARRVFLTHRKGQFHKMTRWSPLSPGGFFHHFWNVDPHTGMATCTLLH